MAPRKTAQTPTAGPQASLTRTDTPVDFKAFLKPSSGLQKVTRTRDGSANPLAGSVAYALAEGPQMIPVPLALPDGSKADARAVTNYLRRDLGEQNARLHVQYQDDNGNVLHTKREKVDGKTVTHYPTGVTQVHFAVKAGKTERKYTVADIREWAEQNGHGKITGKVPAHVRDAFKVAKGYAKDDNATDERSA